VELKEERIARKRTVQSKAKKKADQRNPSGVRILEVGELRKISEPVATRAGGSGSQRWSSYRKL
jgi:hypothetical protein